MHDTDAATGRLEETRDEWVIFFREGLAAKSYDKCWFDNGGFFVEGPRRVATNGFSEWHWYCAGQKQYFPGVLDFVGVKHDVLGGDRSGVVFGDLSDSCDIRMNVTARTISDFDCTLLRADLYRIDVQCDMRGVGCDARGQVAVMTGDGFDWAGFRGLSQDGAWGGASLSHSAVVRGEDLRARKFVPEIAATLCPGVRGYCQFLSFGWSICEA